MTTITSTTESRNVSLIIVGWSLILVFQPMVVIHGFFAVSAMPVWIWITLNLCAAVNAFIVVRDYAES